MSRTTNESEDGMASKYHSDSPLIDDGSGGSSNGGVLKKGPWTSNEDSILIQYVKTHGEGNWNAVQKHSGLSRCGKSCRLRWANHLRPNLKKGAITVEEEKVILELHSTLGNKWARMASYLPGRTDNEIKNYWNTRVKRRQRAGLPLYPPGVMQVPQENQQGQSSGALSCEDSGQHGSLQGNNTYEIPDVIFDGLNRNSDAFSYVSEFSEVSAALMKSTPHCYGFMPQTFNHRQKRLRELSNVYSDAIHNSFPPQVDQFQSVASQNIASSFGASFPQDLDLAQTLLAFDAAQGVHSLPNGNLSASGPANGAVKQELPSLQYNTRTDLCDWGSSPPPPLLESVDAYIQSPAQTVAFKTNHCDAPPLLSGLLDDLIQQSNHMSSVKKHSSEDSSNSSNFTPGDMFGDDIFSICDPEWYGFAADPTTPVGYSETSFMNNVTLPGDTLGGIHVKSEPADTDQSPDSKKPMNIRPDALLGSGWLDCDRDIMADAIATLFCGDQGIGGNDGTGSGSSSSSQEWGCSSCEWNSMPSAVHPISKRC